MSQPLSTPAPRVPIRQKIILGFGLALIMIGVVAFFAFQSTQAFIRAAQRVAQSRQVLELNASLQARLMQVENCARGFLIAGEEPYLRPMEEATKGMAADCASLRHLAAEDPMQLQRIDRIEPLLTRKVALLKEAIETRRKEGLDEAAALIASPENFSVSGNLKRLLDELGRDERQRLERRSNRTDIIARSATVFIVSATVFTVLFLLLAAFIILRDIQARHEAEEALIDEHHLLRSVMDAMPDQVYVTDFYGHCIIDNVAHREFLKQLDGNDGLEDFDATGYEGQAIRRGESILNSEQPLLMPNGEIRWLSRNKIPLRDTAGNLIGMVGVNSDISERKEAEEQIKLAAKQMERSNRDLQDFASVASHDLQEPLRKILAFGDRLRVKCQAQLGDNGRDYLERMTNAAERMQKLIQSLLTLSRVTSKAMPFGEVDLRKIAEEVVSDLEVRIEQSSAIVDIGPLPTIQADPNQMRQLFQNLIANALKFQKPGSKPEVSVSGKIVEMQENQMPGHTAGSKFCQIMFSDNGIGFDQKFAERIFVVFQRLHGRLEYEGTGIGLSVCRRITERHSGFISAKSEEGAGATFIVTLPVNQLIKDANYEAR